ncbi:hypothetical protein GCM10010260_80360 [Streptomyces filipinensis]|uniref:Uncharacterized protein n=1 Tax=Streptomyces filipinensis TaxID=66887 RepID=A0A918MG34_9ACTN|nr:hypothetical protein [Streptomyces filipinensis]GGV27771.1 hypothetical protein GCM10010260_80360 [Streptomyces filipinensis]
MPHLSKDYEVKNLPDQENGFSWNLTGESLSVFGACPECAGEMEQPVPHLIPGAVAKGRRGGGASADEVPGRVYMQCACAYPHRGDADETGGCGAAWTAVRSTGGTP